MELILVIVFGVSNSGHRFNQRFFDNQMSSARNLVSCCFVPCSCFSVPYWLFATLMKTRSEHRIAKKLGRLKIAIVKFSRVSIEFIMMFLDVFGTRKP